MNTEFIIEWEDLVDGERHSGTLLNSAYCPVGGCWHLLVAASDGMMKHLRSDTIGASIYGVVNSGNEETNDE